MNYNAYKIKKHLMTLGVLVLLVLSLLIGFFAYIGTYTGTFIIGIEERYDGNISLSETRNFDMPTALLQAEPRENAWPIEYKNIDINGVLNTDGNFSTKNYFGYTFYLKNVGETTIQVAAKIKQTQDTKNLKSCIRLMLFEDDKPIGVFRWKDGYIDEQDTTPSNLYFEYDSAVVYDYILPPMKPGDVKKFSVIVWLEGWDKDCTDNKKGGAIAYNMNLSIIDTEIYEQKK